MRIKIKEKDLFKKLIKKNFNYEIDEINSFCLDSRLLKKNDIFLPIKGKNFDPQNILAEIMLQFAYPRLDIAVSKGLNHLLKSPFCVHPKTGEKVNVPKKRTIKWKMSKDLFKKLNNEKE